MNKIPIEDALAGVAGLYLDTAPVIYFVEKNPAHFDRARHVFDRIDLGTLDGVVSVVTLAECLVRPLQLGLIPAAGQMVRLLTRGRGMRFIDLDSFAARQAADIRARYNLSLADSLQIAAALEGGCDAILTNDHAMKRVTEIRVLVLDDLSI